MIKLRISLIIAIFIILAACLIPRSQNTPLLSVPQGNLILIGLLFRRARAYHETFLLCSTPHNRNECIIRVFEELGWVSLAAAGFIQVTGWSKYKYEATLEEDFPILFYTNSDSTLLNNRDNIGNNI